MLHYFPPVVAGVIVPGLVVIALIVIPYFKVNIEADGVFLKDRPRRLAHLLCDRDRVSCCSCFCSTFTRRWCRR